MRSFTRRLVIVGTCLAGGVVWSGCEAKQATEYVTGISTQVSVPRDLKAVRIEVTVGGVPQFCQGYRVYDGKVQLPRSLGTYATTDRAITSGPITYTISGVTDSDIDTDWFGLCARPVVGEGNVRVLRRSRQPYIPDEILFLPMPLKYSCYDKVCGEEETCKGGTCVSATLTAEQAKQAFPRYTPDLVDGTGGGCFSTKLCMGAAAPAILIDADTCEYAVASSPSAPPPVDPKVDPFRPGCDASSDCPTQVCTILDPDAAPPEKKGRCEPLRPGTPWEGTNVEVVYDGGLNREILDLDPDEGFVFTDPANPQRFKLAPGLCEMVKGGVGEDGKPTTHHRITAVRASGTCQPKRLAQPFCAADALGQMGVSPDGIADDPAPPNDCASVELKPPRAALMVIVDNTEAHSAFFNAEQIKAVEFPLKDPAFERTDIGLRYAPISGDGCATDAAPVIPLERALTARQKLVDDFLRLAADPAALAPGSPRYQGALASTYATLSALSSTTYFKRAVVVVGNREFNADLCDGIAGKPADLALAARTAPADPTKPIDTYVIQLAKTDPSKSLQQDVLDPGLAELAQAGNSAPPNPDARGTKKNAKDAFQQIINALATCVYDVPSDAPVPLAEDTVSFSDPLGGATTTIPPNPSCTTEGAPGTGWGFGADAPTGTKRIHLCADSCGAYRSTLAQASDFALVYNHPPIAVPIFAHKKSCGPK